MTIVIPSSQISSGAKGHLFPDQFGADSTGTKGSTTAIQEAASLLPFIELTDNTLVQAGTLELGAGNYIINEGGNTLAGMLPIFSPWVGLIGQPGTILRDANSSFTVVTCTGGWSTVAAGSNGVNPNTWTAGSPGTLNVASATTFSATGGTAQINNAASGKTVTFSYTGTSGNTLTGCVKISGATTVINTGDSCGDSTLFGSGFIAAGVQVGMWIMGGGTNAVIALGGQVTAVTNTTITMNDGLNGVCSARGIGFHFPSIQQVSPGLGSDNPGTSGAEWSKANIRNLIIDGSNTAAGTCCIYSGCGEDANLKDLTIQNYGASAPSISQQNPWGMPITMVDTGIGWNEGWDIKLTSLNNHAGICFLGNKLGIFNSQSQGRLRLHLNAIPGYHGIWVINGSGLYHAQVNITGLMSKGTSGNTGALFFVHDPNSQIIGTRIDARVECDQFANDAGTTAPNPVQLDTSSSGCIMTNNSGDVNLGVGGQNWAPSTASGGFAKANFTFEGNWYAPGDTGLVAGGTAYALSATAPSAGGPELKSHALNTLP